MHGSRLSHLLDKPSVSKDIFLIYLVYQMIYLVYQIFELDILIISKFHHKTVRWGGGGRQGSPPVVFPKMCLLKRG